MKIAMVGLGKMGANMAQRLIGGGHEVVGYDPRAEAVAELRVQGGAGVAALADLVPAFAGRRAVWLMIPAGELVDRTLDELLPLLSPGDVVIDGGNSFYKDTLRRAGRLSAAGLHLVDAGTSGGVWGLKEGYSLMVGGDEEAVEFLRPVLATLAPAEDRGWGRVGPAGSGHFVKMVHNGIEYGMMQAFAEGFAVMRAKEPFGLDLAQISKIWQHGSVVRSWLLDLTARALEADSELADVAPYVPDSGEGRWTVAEAIELDVPAPVLTLSLIERLSSREDDSYAYKLLSAMRGQFGGHAVRSAGEAR